ncbi:hypothetical protein [Pedobacter hiemivivus]|uniref:hypothetical protein n=1 Tax=Pedobacter hiemivivus TaxID=2530454 RepID=UPI0013F1756D|nr:hypothetical protein [Pedobacter hiemivivus]
MQKKEIISFPPRIPLDPLDTLPSRKGTCLWVWCEGSVNKVWRNLLFGYKRDGASSLE